MPAGAGPGLVSSCPLDDKVFVRSAERVGDVGVAGSGQLHQFELAPEAQAREWMMNSALLCW